MSKERHITKEDAQNVINYNAAFGVTLSDEDNKFLKEMSEIEGEFTQAQAQKLKIFLCNMLVTSTHESFQGELWDQPKEAAQEILDEEADE